MKKRWRVEEADKGLQAELGRRLDILPITAQLLINRGLVDHDRAFSFLRPELKDLHDPFLLKGMDKAASRAVEAVIRRETVAIYGDYDVDGTCAAAVLHGFFAAAGTPPVVYIPHRQKEGYGLNKGALDYLNSLGVTLVITVDCGMSNADEVKYASSLGMDVIVTDHHEPGAEPPGAYAVVNPKQKGCAFPFKGLAGVGVAFNFIMALRALLRRLGRFNKTNEPNLLKYTDLVCVGTVADMVPLLDENRVLVSYGLKELASSSRPGLEALKEVSAVRRDGRLDADAVAFQLAPRINAAGRLSKADAAFRLLTTADEGEARSFAAELDSENSRRQKLEADMFKEALAMLQPAPADKGIVLYSDSWHPGVVGIVASRLVERFSRPAVVISLKHGVGKGSARGTRSFDMLEGLAACAGFLTRYGGHRAAAGLTVDEKNLRAFRDEFVKFANLRLTDEDLMSEIRMDAVVSINELGERLIAEIESLAPFGVANRTPLFCLENARIAATEVAGRHLRFVLSHQGVNFRGIGFGMAPMHPLEGDGFAVAFSPYLDEWQGGRRLGFKIKDVQGQANALT